LGMADNGKPIVVSEKLKARIRRYMASPQYKKPYKRTAKVQAEIDARRRIGDRKLRALGLLK